MAQSCCVLAVLLVHLYMCRPTTIPSVHVHVYLQMYSTTAPYMMVIQAVYAPLYIHKHTSSLYKWTLIYDASQKMCVVHKSW